MQKDCDSTFFEQRMVWYTTVIDPAGIYKVHESDSPDHSNGVRFAEGLPCKRGEGHHQGLHSIFL